MSPLSDYIDKVPCSLCDAQPGEPCDVRRGNRPYHLSRADRGAKNWRRAKNAQPVPTTTTTRKAIA